MATLAAHDPRHGLNPWLRIEDHPSIHSCRGPAINFVRVWVRALARSGVGQQLRNSAPQHESLTIVALRYTRSKCPEAVGQGTIAFDDP